MGLVLSTEGWVKGEGAKKRIYSQDADAEMENSVLKDFELLDEMRKPSSKPIKTDLHRPAPSHAYHQKLISCEQFNVILPNSPPAWQCVNLHEHQGCVSFRPMAVQVGTPILLLQGFFAASVPRNQRDNFYAQ